MQSQPLSKEEHSQPKAVEDTAKSHRSRRRSVQSRKQESLEKQEQPGTDNRIEVVVPEIHLHRSETRYTNHRLDLSSSGKLGDTVETIEDYRQEIHELRRINIKLKNDLLELSQRLDTEIAKRLANQTKAKTVADKELDNTHKMNINLKREIRLLQKRVENGSADRVEQLTNQLRSKQEEVAQLQSEIKALKKVSTFQERGLVDAANDGLLTYMRENRELHLEIRKLEQRCEASEREARKNRIPQRPAEVKTEDERVPVLQKQVDALKAVDAKNKKDILVLTFEKNRLADEIGKLNSKLEEKDKEIASLNVKIVELRKCMRPKPKPVEPKPAEAPQEQQPAKQRVKTLEDEPSSKSRVRTQSKSSKLVETSSVHSRSTRRSQPLQKKPLTPSVRIVSTKLYRPSYPKMEERGVQNPQATKFNDHALSSKITSVSVFLDGDNQLSWVEARYQKGSPASLFPEQSGSKATVFTCEEGEFVQYVSGGFSNDFVDYLALVTNTKRLVKYGIELPTSTKFDFNISQKEFPCALFGEVTKTVLGYRINRIGCFIQALPENGQDSEFQTRPQSPKVEQLKPMTAGSATEPPNKNESNAEATQPIKVQERDDSPKDPTVEKQKIEVKEEKKEQTSPPEVSKSPEQKKDKGESSVKDPAADKTP